MRIGDVTQTPLPEGRVAVSAVIGDVPLEFRVPITRFNPRAIGDALLIQAIVPAMRAGSAIRLPDDVPVSSVLLRAVPGIQRIYRAWNARLRQVPVEASSYEPADDGRGVGLFYAGGIDSSYSLLAHRAEVDALVAIFGFDINMSEADIAVSEARNRRFADRLGKEFLYVESSARAFVLAHGVSRIFVFGSILASVALLLGFRRCYIASSHSTATNHPDGSHPALDPRFSNGTTEIVHDDVSVTRVEKTRAVGADPLFLDNLRVCWELVNENCGACSKCVRTMTTLRLLGAPRGPFPPLADLAAVAEMARRSDQDFLTEMILAAHEAGDRDVLRALKRGQRAKDRKEGLRLLFQGLTGARVPPLFRRRRTSDNVKNDLRPDLDVR